MAARAASRTIPIVIETALDPVGAGLAESLAHPGGNITGCSLLAPETIGKTLSLPKQAAPNLQRVAVLWNSANQALAPVWQAVDAAARSLGMIPLSQAVHDPQDLRRHSLRSRRNALAGLSGLLSYGPNRAATERDAADYVAKVLKGANPAELPFVQPTQFELVINLKTATTLGLTLPQLLLAQADEVIE